MQHDVSLVSGAMRRIATAAGAIVLALLVAAPAGAQAPGGLDATIRRTAHGIPHIEARDFAGLGYGYGYAFAEDNVCTIAEQYVTVRGERSRFFGPDATYSWRANSSLNRNLESDFAFKRIIDMRVVEGLVAKAPPNGPRPEVRELVRGYTAGYNRYLGETGVGNLPDPACRGKEWVRPIEEIDVYRRFYQLALLASTGVALDGDRRRAAADPRAARPAPEPRRTSRRSTAASRSATSAPTRTGSGARRPTTARACCSATPTSRGTAPSASIRPTS